MFPWYASISLSLAVLAIGFSTVSLLLHWIRDKNEPDITELHSRLQGLQTDHLDLLDKVEHWRKRDNVRRARQGAEEKASVANAESTDTAGGGKRALRERAAARGLGIIGRNS